MQLPPGPSSSALVQTLQFVTRPLPFFDRCLRDYGHIYTIKLIGVGHSVHQADALLLRALLRVGQ